MVKFFFIFILKQSPPYNCNAKYTSLPRVFLTLPQVIPTSIPIPIPIYIPSSLNSIKVTLPVIYSKIFKRPKNREDGSDFGDFLTKSIASLRTFFFKIFAPLENFSSDRSGPRSARDRSETADRTGPDRISVPIRRTAETEF